MAVDLWVIDSFRYAIVASTREYPLEPVAAPQHQGEDMGCYKERD